MISESWLAVSTWSGRRSRLGIEASLAGIQNSAQSSIRKVAANSQASSPTSGIERNSAARSTSQTTIWCRRSSLSASAPASGPSTIAGSSLVATTPPSAKLCAW
jgi:hypothetical protein